MWVLRQAAALHKLVQHGSLSWCAVLQEQTAPVWVTSGTTVPTRRLFQHGLSTGSQLPSGHIHVVRRGVLHRLKVDICFTVDLHGLQGDNLPHHGSLHWLQVNLCSSTWSTSFFTDLGVCKVVSLTYSHSILSSAVAQHFSSFLKYFIPEVLTTSLMGSAFASSWNCLCLTQGQLLVSSHRSHLCSPSPTETLLHKPNTGPVKSLRVNST